MPLYAVVILFVFGMVAWVYLKLGPGPRGRRASDHGKTVSQRAQKFAESNRPEKKPLNPEARRETGPAITEFDRI